MAKANGHGPLYSIHFMGRAEQKIDRLQRRAARQGRGLLFLAAL